MSLRMAVLGLLSQSPLNGFAIVREFDIGRSVIWPAPQNEVYRVLAALARDGLVEKHAAGPRGARTYKITETGSAQLEAWLAAPSDYSLRYEPILKAVFLRDAAPKLRHARAQADLAFFAAQLAILEGGPSNSDMRSREDALHMAIGLYRALAAWARDIAEAETR